MNVIQWIGENIQEILAVLGSGALSGVITKKAVDRHQDRKIASLTKKMTAVENRATKLEKDVTLTIRNMNSLKMRLQGAIHEISKNNALDEQLRNELKQRFSALDTQIQNLIDGQKTLTDYNMQILQIMNKNKS